MAHQKAPRPATAAAVNEPREIDLGRIDLVATSKNKSRQAARAHANPVAVPSSLLSTLEANLRRASERELIERLRVAIARLRGRP